MGVTTQVPSAVEVREVLAAMSRQQLLRVAQRSRVPLPTLVKIRCGQTTDPRIDTVHAIWPHLWSERP